MSRTHPKRPEIAGIDEAVALDLPDDSVDAAFANMVLHPRGGPEHADVWLGFSDDRIQEFFAAAGIERPSLESLGKQ